MIIVYWYILYVSRIVACLYWGNDYSVLGLLRYHKSILNQCEIMCIEGWGNLYLYRHFQYIIHGVFDCIIQIHTKLIGYIEEGREFRTSKLIII
jgi:hypothetical protein